MIFDYICDLSVCISGLLILWSAVLRYWSVGFLLMDDFVYGLYCNFSENDL